MFVKKLDHCNILTDKLAETIDFYVTALDMRVSPPARGKDTSEGAYIYDNDDWPVLHVQGIDPEDPERRFARVRDRLGDLAGTLSIDAFSGSGAIEHIALLCTGYERLAERLSRLGLPMRTNEVPGRDLRQIFIKDPNGIVLELSFFGSD
jgi:catechol 2,3-dioxygenase-like lactoylglutathione lyase family enzyme